MWLRNMALKSWMALVLWVLLLWISPVLGPKSCDIKRCLRKDQDILIVDNGYTGVMNQSWASGVTEMAAGPPHGLPGPPHASGRTNICTISAKQSKYCKTGGFWMKKVSNDSHLLYMSKNHVKRGGLCLCVVLGEHCNKTLQSVRANITDCKTRKAYFTHNQNNCSISCFKTEMFCKGATYNKEICPSLFSPMSKNNDKYVINVTQSGGNCFNCNNPVKKAEVEVRFLQQSGLKVGENINPVVASQAIRNMSLFATQMNESSAAVTMGPVTGVIVKQQDYIEEVSFGYLNSSMNIVENRDELSGYTWSVSVSKEAFEKASNLTNGTAFVGVFRFPNMTKDDKNSTVLNNEVLAVEMGVAIANLTDKIKLNYRNVKKTITNADLTSLTYITYVGCGMSMFFLGVALFMHFLLRKAKASTTTQVLIQLFLAMFLLNFTFLTNKWIADLRSLVGCQIMAGAMHYSMLATFSWFAIEAFHLGLQLYNKGNVSVQRYILKVCIAGWCLPGLVVIILFSLGKYGEQVIHTNEGKEVIMCWITDNNVHYIVNIGSYVLVFCFTFTIFVIVTRWLILLKGTQAGTAHLGTDNKDIFTVLGLCCLLGITWSFAFFAYGVLQMPSYYIFTILNSFQGFFLFLYYYNTSRIIGETQDSSNSGKSSSTNTVNSTLPWDT